MKLVGFGLAMLWINTIAPTYSQSIFSEARYTYEDTIRWNKVIRLMGLHSKRGSGVLQRFRPEALLQGRARWKQWWKCHAQHTRFDGSLCSPIKVNENETHTLLCRDGITHAPKIKHVVKCSAESGPERWKMSTASTDSPSSSFPHSCLLTPGDSFVNMDCSYSTILITKRNWAISKVLASLRSYLDKTSINTKLRFDSMIIKMGFCSIRMELFLIEWMEMRFHMTEPNWWESTTGKSRGKANFLLGNTH